MIKITDEKQELLKKISKYLKMNTRNLKKVFKIPLTTTIYNNK